MNFPHRNIRYVRDESENDIYGPRECPNYENTGYFTIKYIHGGYFVEQPEKHYGGVMIRYVDLCHYDFISLIDMMKMLTEIGYKEEDVQMFRMLYKISGTDMRRGLFAIDNDDDVLIMAELILRSRLIEVYVDDLDVLKWQPLTWMKANE